MRRIYSLVRDVAVLVSALVIGAGFLFFLILYSFFPKPAYKDASQTD